MNELKRVTHSSLTSTLKLSHCFECSHTHISNYIINNNNSVRAWITIRRWNKYNEEMFRFCISIASNCVCFEFDAKGLKWIQTGVCWSVWRSGYARYMCASHFFFIISLSSAIFDGNRLCRVVDCECVCACICFYFSFDCLMFELNLNKSCLSMPSPGRQLRCVIKSSNFDWFSQQFHPKRRHINTCCCCCF